jgi:hypothetical protein
MNKHVSFHRPEFYRYEVSRPGFRIGPNHYGWRRIIGAYVVIGRFAYCVKWAWAK